MNDKRTIERLKQKVSIMEQFRMEPRLTVNPSLDPGEVSVAAQAVRDIVNGMTYWGQNIGSYVTDDQCNAVAAAVVTAVEDYRSTKKG
jgi:hypothetical protein